MSASAKKNQILKDATTHWKYVAPLLAYPKSESAYHLLVERLDAVLDIIGDDENHSLMGLADILSHLISAYEEDHVKLNATNGISALKYLMQLRGLNQADLHAIGSQGVVSEILSGKRKLNIRQIKILAKQFKVTPITFIDE